MANPTLSRRRMQFSPIKGCWDANACQASLAGTRRYSRPFELTAFGSQRLKRYKPGHRATSAILIIICDERA